MSCGGEVLSDRSGHCVTSVVKGIVKAQHRAVESMEDSCATSCDRSIEELLSPSRDSNRRRRHNTIPFILYCKNSCKPFVGSGIRKHDRHFNCVESPVFRAKNFVRGSNTCVRIELLKPAHGGGHSSDGGKDQDCNCGCGGSICSYFPKDSVQSFRPTGICITVDLTQFFGISCLDAVTIR